MRGARSIMSAGAMGAFYASKFSDMDENCISFIASGERYERLKKEGFVVNNKQYILPVIKPDDTVPPADLVIVAVKNHHLQEAIQDMRNRIGEKTAILSVMNEIDSEERIGAVYGRDKVLYAIAVGIDALREGNSMKYTTQGKLFFGEAENTVLTERVRRIQLLFDRARIVYEMPDDMILILWWKFMINVGINQTSAVMRAPYGVFQTSHEARELMDSVMREVTAIAEAADIRISGKDIENRYFFISVVPGR